MTKKTSLFGVSMKISVCREGIWGKEGENIRYYETLFDRSNKVFEENIGLNLNNKNLNGHKFYYALEFDLKIKKG